MTLEGRLAYSWGSGDRPPRIEAALTAPEIESRPHLALAQGIFGDTAFEWPREGTLALKVGRAAFAGVEARRADVDMQFDRSGLEIERLVGRRSSAARPSPSKVSIDTGDARSARRPHARSRCAHARWRRDGGRQVRAARPPSSAAGRRVSCRPRCTASLDGESGSRAPAALAAPPRSRSRAAPAPSRSACRAVPRPSDAFTVGQSCQLLAPRPSSPAVSRPAMAARWSNSSASIADRGRQARRAIQFHGQRAAQWRHDRGSASSSPAASTCRRTERCASPAGRADRRARRQGRWRQACAAAAARRRPAGGDVAARAHAPSSPRRRRHRSHRYRRQGCRR